MRDVPADVVSPAVVELLAWISRERRTYDETIEAWKTHCPRLSAWEDALAGGLVRLERGDGGELCVALTPAGAAALPS